MVSVIVPIYNSAETLDRCIESMLQQTCSQWELILVNDGSEDNSLDICQKAAESDWRIKVLAQPNCGVVAARNAGIAAAKGEWIAFLDSDDWFSPHFIESMLVAAESARADIAWCNVREMHYESEKIICYIPSTDIILDLLTSNTHGWLWNKIYRRDFWDKIKVETDQRCGIMEDSYILIQLYGCNPKIAYVDQALYNYNCTDIQSAASSPFVMGRGYINIINIYDWLINNGKYKSYKRAIDRLIARSKIDRLKMNVYISEPPHIERNIKNIPLSFPINVFYWSAFNSRFFRKYVFNKFLRIR